MDRYYPVDITTPKGTTVGAPLNTPVPLENNYLVDIEVLIPPGHAALTGIRVKLASQQVLPWGNNSWIKADNYVRVFDINTEIGANAVSIDTYNQDFIDHTFYIRIHLRDKVSADSGSLSQIFNGGTGAGGIGGGLGGVGTVPPVTPPPVVPVPPVLPPPPPPGGGSPGGTSGPPSAANRKTMLLWN